MAHDLPLTSTKAQPQKEQEPHPQPNALMLPHVQASAVGLVFPDETTEEQFREVGSLLASAQRSMQWFWGDWLLFAADRAEKGGKGRRNSQLIMEEGPALYALAEEMSHLSYQTLQNYKRVCQAVSIYRRREKLSFAHHEVIAGIADEAVQDNWLDKAEKKGWSVSELRVAVRLAERTEPAAKPDPEMSLRSQILREMESLASLLKKEVIEDLPEETQDVWIERLEPMARIYDELCTLRNGDEDEEE